MANAARITARVEPKLRASSARVLERIGVSTSDAITMFLRQVVRRRGIPFDTRVPNTEAARQLRSWKGARRNTVSSHGAVALHR